MKQKPKKLQNNMNKAVFSKQDMQDIKTFKNAFDNHISLYQIYKISNKELEQIYGLGYDMIQNEQYVDGEDIFRSLCLLKHTEDKFWIGLGICLQKQKKYPQASMMYGMAIICNPKNPLSYLLGSQCALAQKDISATKYILNSAQNILKNDSKYKIINQIIKYQIKNIAKS